MKRYYWVRVGSPGYVGTFSSDQQSEYSRGVGVLCQTGRGLEVGEVLSDADRPTDDAAGALIRPLSSADGPHLLRLETKAKSAYRWCTHWLKQHGSANMLMDVEALFDSKTLYFYFMGGPPENNAPLVTQLRCVYQTDIQFRHYGDTATAGSESGCCAGGGCCSQPTAETSDSLLVGGGCQRGDCSDCGAAAHCGRRVDSA